jgi:hypothetical protein
MLNNIKFEIHRVEFNSFLFLVFDVIKEIFVFQLKISILEEIEFFKCILLYLKILGKN